MWRPNAVYRKKKAAGKNRQGCLRPRSEKAKAVPEKKAERNQPKQTQSKRETGGEYEEKQGGKNDK